ncbi:alpha/beta fold hydrolase [Nocardia sp. NPDC051570]|uniref:alpha/beta fold hydrolase n=1 Tax=Nocardia sp. NPDC051570 TaxID=3364324 RepID=UPI00379C36A4
MLDPVRFAGYDPGYLTTAPGTRADAFATPDTDPDVLAADEAHKDVFSPTEFATALTSMILPLARDVHVPVLIANGTEDRLCAAVCASSESLQQAEVPWFSPDAHLRAFVLPDSGHAINFARGAATYQASYVTGSIPQSGSDANGPGDTGVGLRGAHFHLFHPKRMNCENSCA